MNTSKNFLKCKFLIILLLIFSCISQQIYADEDFAAINYAAAEAPGIKSCTVGFDALSGDIEYSKNLISGTLPYTINYRAPLRQNAKAYQDFTQPEKTNSGWTDNYHSYLIIQHIKHHVEEYTERKVVIINKIPTVQTSNFVVNPPYTDIKALTFKLPGENKELIILENNGEYRRIYAVDTGRSFLEESVSSLWSDASTSLGEYKLTKESGIYKIEKYGTSYTFSQNGYQITTPQSSSKVSNTYYVNGTGWQNTSESWTYENKPYYASTNTAPHKYYYLTVSANLYKITKMDDGKKNIINFDYDSNFNLIKLTDRYNNKLIFERNFHDNNLGSSQTIDETRLITKVTYLPSIGEPQVAIMSYKAYAHKNIRTETMTNLFSLISSESTSSGKFTYVNKMTENGAAKLYLAKKAKTADNTNFIPVLYQVKDSTNQVERQWDVTQNYSLNGSGTKSYYSMATTTLRSYSPVLYGQTDKDYLASYDDYHYTINISAALQNGFTKTNTQITRIPTGRQIYSIEITGAPCLTFNDVPLRKVTFDVLKSKLRDTYSRNDGYSSFTYDELGRLVKLSESYDRTTTYVYDKINNELNNFLTPTSIVKSDITINNEVNSRGQILKQTQSSTQSGSTSKTTTYSYDENLNSPHYARILSVDGPLSGENDKIFFSYDSFGNLLSQSQKIKNVERTTQYLEYNSYNLPQRVVKPNGMVEISNYNNDGTLNTKVIGIGGSTGNISGQQYTYTYNGLKRLISESNPDGETIKYEYDYAGRVTKITQHNGTYATKEYFATGTPRVEKSFSSTGIIASEKYNFLDSNGWISKTQIGGDANKNVKSFTYDKNGNLIQKTSAEGIIEKWTYDLLNRVTSHTDGEGNVDTKEHDLNNNVILVKDALNAGSAPLNYKNGRVLVKETNSDYGVKAYTHNEADQLTQKLHGVRKCNYGSLDEIGRFGTLTCTLNSGATSNESMIKNNYIFDESRYGRLDKVTTGLTGYDVDTYYSYDIYDRVIQKATTNQLFNRYASKTGQSLSVNYTYTLSGKLKSITLPSGRNLTYSYSTNGMLNNISLNGSQLIRNISYDGADRVVSWQWGGSGNASYSQNYSTNNSINNIINTDNSSNINYSLEYSYDKDGRIIQISKNNGIIDNYTYDKADRLKNETRSSNSNSIYNISYTYDNNGNRTALTATGQHMQPSANVSYIYSGNKLSQITKDTIAQNVSHSGNGELTYGTYAPAYDMGGRRKFDRSSADYYYMNYNHKNERSYRGKVINSAVSTMTQYVYDEQSHLIGEYDKNGVIVEYIWLGDKPIAAIYGVGTTAQVYYIITDAQNTPRRLVTSAYHSVEWAWDSTAFGLGNPTGSITFNLRFPGQYYDAATGQFYNQNRYYNPELGRYMEADPIGLEGGLNPYTYAGSNPVMYFDATGLKLTYLDNDRLSSVNVEINNLNWLNHQQNMIENAAGKIGLGISYNGFKAKDYITYNASVKGMIAMGYGGSYRAGGWRPQTRVDMKYISNSLQNMGHMADGAAVACGFTVVCAPAAPAIGTVGALSGAIGTVIDPDSSRLQKVVSIIVPTVVGRYGEKAVSGSTVSDAVATAYGTIFDKIVGESIDAKFKCEEEKSC